MKLSLLLCAAALLVGCNNQNQGGTGANISEQSGSQGSRTPDGSASTNQIDTQGANQGPPGTGTGTGARGTATGGASAGPATP
jgi:hypothetical protein